MSYLPLRCRDGQNPNRSLQVCRGNSWYPSFLTGIVGFGNETSCLLSSKQDVTASLAFSLACVLDEPQDTSPVSVCCVQLFEVLSNTLRNSGMSSSSRRDKHNVLTNFFSPLDNFQIKYPPPPNSPTDCGGTLSNIFIDSSEDDNPYHILFSFILFLFCAASGCAQC